MEFLLLLLLCFKSFIQVYTTYKIRDASYKILQIHSCLIILGSFKTFPSLHLDSLGLGHGGTKHRKCPSEILYRTETEDTKQELNYTKLN